MQRNDGKNVHLVPEITVTQLPKMVVMRDTTGVTREKIEMKGGTGTQDQDLKVALPFNAPNRTR